MSKPASTWYGLPSVFWYLWLGAFISRLGGFVMLFLPIYLTERRGFSIESASLAVSLYGAGSLFAGPLGGTLADRVGRRFTLLLGLLGSALAMLHLGFSASPVRIGFGAMLLGVLSELGRPATQAAIADLVPPSQRMRAYALLYWAINLGFAGAAMLAGVLAHHDFRLLFIGDAASTMIFGLIVFFCVPETLAHAPGEKSASAPSASLLVPYRDPVFLSFVLIQFSVAWVFRQSDSSLALDMTRHGISMPRYGQLLAINGVLIILLQPFVVRYIGRVRRAHALAFGALLTGAGFGMCALGHGQGLYAISIAVWTLGEILFSPLAPALIADLSPPELRGSYQGAFQLSWGGAGLLGPALGGLIMGQLGARTLWVLCLCIGVSAAWLHLVSATARRRRLAALPDGGAALLREDPAASLRRSARDGGAK